MKSTGVRDRAFYATLIIFMWHNTLNLVREGRRKLGWIFEKQRRIEGIELCKSGDQCLTPVNSSEPSGYIKCEEFLDWLSNCQVLKNLVPKILLRWVVC